MMNINHFINHTHIMSFCCKRTAKPTTENSPQYFITINIPSDPIETQQMNPQYEYLSDITYKTCIPYIPNITYGKVVKVYDGDTITIATRIPNDLTIYRFSVRLLGIDTPEIKTKSTREKQLAILSRDALETLIIGQIVQLRNVSIEKYGRILANVYLKEIDLSQWMIEKGYAVPYDGKTKQIPDAWKSDNRD